MVREIFVAEAATTILSIPIPHSTPLGKISSFGYPMLRVFSLSNLPIERLSSMIAMGIRNCPIGRLYERQGCRSVLKCYYGESGPMPSPRERIFSEKCNTLTHLAFSVLQKLRAVSTYSLSVTPQEPYGQFQDEV